MSGKTYEELMEQLAPAERKRVEKRAAELIAEEKSLRELRKAHQLTQQRMARKLGVKQHTISRLEQRSDMLLSTLRDYIGKMGGELVITAEFPDRDPVRLKGIGEIAATSEAGKGGSARASARPPKRSAKVRTTVRTEQTNRRRSGAVAR